MILKLMILWNFILKLYLRSWFVLNWNCTRSIPISVSPSFLYIIVSLISVIYFIISVKAKFQKSKDRINGGFITYELQVVSYELWVVILRIWIYKLRVSFYKLQSNFTNCKFILRVGNKITSCKLLFASCKFKEIVLQVASCELRVVSRDFKKINLRVASYFLWVAK